MNCFLKILLLAGLIHCIAVYASDETKKLQLDLTLLEQGTRVLTPTSRERLKRTELEPQTQKFDPSSLGRDRPVSGIGSQDNLIAGFAGQYADNRSSAGKQKTVEDFIIGLPDQEDRVFAREILHGSLAKRVGALLAPSPRNRGRRLSEDSRLEEVQPSSTKEQLVTAMLEAMRTREEYHKEKMAFMQKQAAEQFKQTAEIAKVGSTNTRWGIGVNTVFGLASLAISIVALTNK